MTVRVAYIWVMFAAWVACDIAWAMIGKDTARDRIGEDMAIGFFLFWVSVLAWVLRARRAL